jgi:hypothetical protein
MLPDIWGKYGWKFLHLVTLEYPENPTPQDKVNYRNFFMDLRGVLPCGKCRINLTENLEKYPLTDNVLSSRDGLVKWLIDIHNVVNYHTGKPMLSYAEAYRDLENLSNPYKFKKSDGLYLVLLVIVLLILGLIYYLFSRRKN